MSADEEVKRMITCSGCGGQHELSISFESIFANHFDFDPYLQTVYYDCPRKTEGDPTQLIELKFDVEDNPSKKQASVGRITDFPESKPEK